MYTEPSVILPPENPSSTAVPVTAKVLDPVPLVIVVSVPELSVIITLMSSNEKNGKSIGNCVTFAVLPPLPIVCCILASLSPIDIVAIIYLPLS